jgi:hypothetical protein
LFFLFVKERFSLFTAFASQLSDSQIFSLKEVTNSRNIHWNNSDGGFFPYHNTFSNFYNDSLQIVSMDIIDQISNFLDLTLITEDRYPLSFEPVTISNDYSYIPPTLSVGDEARYLPGCVPTAMGQIMYHFLKYNYQNAIADVAARKQIPDNRNIVRASAFIVDKYGEKVSSEPGIATMRVARISRAYDWLDMIDKADTDGANLTSSDKNLTIKDTIAPLLFDLAVATNQTHLVNKKGEPAGSDVDIFFADTIFQEFGFEHAVHYGSYYLPEIYLPLIQNEYIWEYTNINEIILFINFSSFMESELIKPIYQEKIRKIIETNIDYGHMVEVDSPTHGHVIEGYGTGKISNDIIFGNKARELKSYFLEYDENVQWSDISDFSPIRLAFNIFPNIPSQIKTLNKTPEILSGRVFPLQVPATDTDAFSQQLFAQATVINDFSPNVLLEPVSVDKRTGIYAIAVPNNSKLQIEILSSNYERHPDYNYTLERKSKTSRYFLNEFIKTGNVHGVDFYPSTIFIHENAIDDARLPFLAHEKNVAYIEETQLVSNQSPLGENVEILTLAPSSNFDINSNYNTNAFINFLTFIANGGKIISTGKSTMPPALLNGTNSPTFYNFSGLNRPYGNATGVNITVTNDRIIEAIGTNTIALSSALPQSEHQLINDPKNTKINAVATYTVQELVTPPGGSPQLVATPVVAPVSIEYDRGVNGGKVIYTNTEIYPNYDGTSMQKAFIDALLEPILHDDDNKHEIFESMGGNYYDGPPVVTDSLKQDNLNMVAYRGYINIDNADGEVGSSSTRKAMSGIGEDVSFLFSIGERTVTSTAAEIDSSGDPDLIVSLYKPSGTLYATRKAFPGLEMVGISVPAIDNDEQGPWKYVIEEIHGIDGNRIVLVAAIDGIYDVYDPYWPDEWPSGTSVDIIIRSAPRQQWPAARRIFSPKTSPRGIINNVYYHKLGSSFKLDEGAVNQISFGGLVNPDDIKIFRMDTDLVFRINGVPDKITLVNWFNSKKNFRVFFERDGSSWNSSDISKRTEVKEPYRIIPIVSNDQYITGSEQNDSLSGDNKQNTHFSPGKGDDAVSFGGKGNTMYYRREDGNDVITGKGTDDSYRIIHFHTDIAPNEVSPTRSGDDMVLLTPSGSIAVKNWFEDPAYKIDAVIFFSNSTEWDARDIEKLASGQEISNRDVEYEYDDRFVPAVDQEDEETAQEWLGSNPNDSSGGGCSTGTALPVIGIVIVALVISRRRKFL